MKRLYTPIIYFLLLVPPLIFFTDLTRNPYYFQIVLLNVVTVLLWMLWLYNGIRERKIIVPKTPLDLPLLAFLAVATLSWGIALFTNLHDPFLRYGVYNEGLKRWLFLLVNALLVYYAAARFADDSNRSGFILAVLWAGWLASVYGIMQYFGIEPFWPKVLNPYGGRSVSTFGNPNFLSSYLVLLVPLAYTRYLRVESSSRRSFYLLFILTYFGALLCTLTRSSWAGLFVALLLTVAALWKYEREMLKKSLKLSVLVPFGVMALLVITWPKSTTEGYNPGVIGRLTETSDARTKYYGSWHQRRLIWSCAWHMVKEDPYFGKGWGCFELFFPYYQGRHLFLEPYRSFRTHANNTHNEVLEIWSQTGTVGFGVYLWLIFSILSFSGFLLRRLEGEKRVLAIALTASLVGMWVDNMLNVSLHFAIPAFLYWWNLGLLAGLGSREERSVEVAGVKKLLPWLCLLAGVLLLGRYTKSLLAERHFFNGFKYSKQNLLQAAIPELEAAHRLQRLEVNANYELANCYARLGMIDRAVWGYQEALRANAGYDEIHFNLATTMMQTGHAEEALKEYTTALYINPLSQESYIAMGTLYFKDIDRFRGACVDLYRQSLFFFPRNKDIWNNLGYLYAASGKPDDAALAYRRALEIDPEFDIARRNLRGTLARMGKVDMTLEQIDTLSRQVEQAIAARNWQSALNSAERLLPLTPNSFKTRLYLANIYFTVGRFSDAIAQYTEALKIDPSNPSALGNLGLAYFQTRQYDRARGELLKLLQVDPQNQLARATLAQIDSLLQNASR